MRRAIAGAGRRSLATQHANQTRTSLAVHDDVTLLLAIQDARDGLHLDSGGKPQSHRREPAVHVGREAQRRKGLRHRRGRRQRVMPTRAPHTRAQVQQPRAAAVTQTHDASLHGSPASWSSPPPPWTAGDASVTW
jgi:hypothetical protein